LVRCEGIPTAGGSGRQRSGIPAGVPAVTPAARCRPFAGPRSRGWRGPGPGAKHDAGMPDIEFAFLVDAA
jgi:hypothetical protein